MITKIIGIWSQEKESKKKHTMTSQAFHILPDNPRSGAVRWQCSYHIKALKTIGGSLEAEFELKKVFRCSMLLRS